MFWLFKKNMSKDLEWRTGERWDKRSILKFRGRIFLYFSSLYASEKLNSITSSAGT